MYENISWGHGSKALIRVNQGSGSSVKGTNSGHSLVPSCLQHGGLTL